MFTAFWLPDSATIIVRKIKWRINVYMFVCIYVCIYLCVYLYYMRIHIHIYIYEIEIRIVVGAMCLHVFVIVILDYILITFYPKLFPTYN